jgi:DNA-binding NtrC family response regulator
MRTIVIVDEQEIISIVCDRERSDQGRITRSVCSALKSLHYTENNPQADLLILDIRGAQSSDTQFRRGSRSRKQNIPVILYSPGCSNQLDLPTWLAGLYRARPSDLSEFKEKVKEFLSFEERIGCCWKTVKSAAGCETDPAAGHRFPCANS